MRFDLGRKLFCPTSLYVLALYGLVFLVISGCGNAVERDHSRQAERFTKLIDQRRYGEVIQLIEENVGEASSYSNLLALAYLGQSGFEPLSLASQILDEQAELSSGPGVLIPGCDSKRLQHFEQLPVRCAIKRLWSHLPDPDDAGLKKARDLLRSTYPKPEGAPAEYNTLLALVESSSAISRLGRILVKWNGRETSQLSEQDVSFILVQMGLASDEALKTLQRSRYSVKNVSRLLTGLDQVRLFNSSDMGLTWIEETGLPLLIRFGGDSSSSAQTEIVKPFLVQALVQIAAQLK